MANPETSPIPCKDLAARFALVSAYAGGEGWSGAVQEKAGQAQPRFLKILDAQSDTQELSLLASLQHPRIPTIQETGCTSEGRVYLLREHLRGKPLQETLPLTETETRNLAVQILEVLAYVHLRSILHLDLKPANILRLDGAEQEYALLDFGLGMRGSNKSSGGTPFFAAPELILGHDTDPRSDLFSLGATLFVALRQSATPLPLARFLKLFPQKDFFTALGATAADLPAPFDTLIPRLVARQPEHRYADAQEALAVLTGTSSRPSLSLLRPDPIQAYEHSLQQSVQSLQPGQDLQIQGGDPEDQRALALHAAFLLGDAQSLQQKKDHLRLRRNPEGQAQQKLAQFEMPRLKQEDIAQHLAQVLNLDSASAQQAAAFLLGEAVNSPAKVGNYLADLVRSGQIQPEGTRWIWPDALAQRSLRPPAQPLQAQPEELRQAAARGLVEAALAVYQQALADLNPSDEMSLRAGLVEGLLAGGEPARALPLVAGLPVHRARTLLDLGDPQGAAQILKSIRDDDLQSLFSNQAQAERIRAGVEIATGQFQPAELRLRRLVAQNNDSKNRIVLGLALSNSGKLEEASETLGLVLQEIDAKSHPFLRAATLTNLGDLMRRCGNPAQANEHHQEALALYRSLGHVRHTATSYSNLGVIAKDQGHFKEALTQLRRAQALFEHVGDRSSAALVQANLGVVSLESGDASSAVRRLQAALADLQQQGSQQSRTLLLLILARAHAELGQQLEAKKLLQELGPLPEQEERLHAELAKVQKVLQESEQGLPISADNLEDREDMVAARQDSIPKEVFRTFLTINRRLAAEANLERAMSYLLDAAVTLTGGRNGFLLVSRPNGLRKEFRSVEGGESASAFSRSMVNKSMQLRRTLTAEDARADQALLDMPSVRNLQQQSAICVPFVSASGTEGALFVEHPGRSGLFGDDEKAHLEILADQAAIAVDRMLHEERLAAELAASRRDLAVAKRQGGGKTPAKMIGESPGMQELQRQIDKLAAADIPVLVLGETGSGKELVALAIHAGSNRNKGPFVAENCSAIPQELMESEFFGHKKGAFTGADEERAGILELASGGTLFLDEIGDMPLNMQAKLLRALQDKTFRRVGGRETIPVDVRLLAATHHDLQAMMKEKSFRQDLYFRIAAAEVRVPPLRDRGQDIALLTQEFLARLNRQHRRQIGISETTLQSLLGYAWPGNVRELEHVISRAFILTEGEDLQISDLPKVTESTPGPQEWPAISLREAESRTILAALQATKGDKTKAARLLGISRTALYEKLKRMQQQDS